MLRADDAGASPAVNRAIRRVVEAGMVRNVSVLACGPAVAELADWLPSSGVAIGLHVCLNSEWPDWRWGPVAEPSQVGSLVEADGAFTRAPRFLRERGFRLEEAIAEVRAQLARLRELGLEPKYWDEHMGVAGLPGLQDAVETLGREEGLGAANRWPVLPASGTFWTELLGLPEAAAIRITHPGGDRFMPDDVRNKRDAETEELCSEGLSQALRHHGVRSVPIA